MELPLCLSSPSCICKTVACSYQQAHAVPLPVLPKTPTAAKTPLVALVAGNLITGHPRTCLSMSSSSFSISALAGSILRSYCDQQMGSGQAKRSHT